MKSAVSLSTRNRQTSEKILCQKPGLVGKKENREVRVSTTAKSMIFQQSPLAQQQVVRRSPCSGFLIKTGCIPGNEISCFNIVIALYDLAAWISPESSPRLSFSSSHGESVFRGTTMFTKYLKASSSPPGISDIFARHSALVWLLAFKTFNSKRKLGCIEWNYCPENLSNLPTAAL